MTKFQQFLKHPITRIGVLHILPLTIATPTRRDKDLRDAASAEPGRASSSPPQNATVAEEDPHLAGSSATRSAVVPIGVTAHIRTLTDHHFPGYAISETELLALGFVPLSIQVRQTVTIPQGEGSEWNTLGVVPEGPGHYLFTVEQGDEVRVVYVGLTEHLWMVTKGYLPRGGGARPGQRYGRPIYAGATRKRVNLLATEQLAFGRRVRHWVRPLEPLENALTPTRSVLAAGEEDLIRAWRLREVGCNIA